MTCGPVSRKPSWGKKEITSVRKRVEQDALRRAKKREHQLQELGRGRFKEPLSMLEKKHVAERERIKGNESFKVSEAKRFTARRDWSTLMKRRYGHHVW